MTSSNESFLQVTQNLATEVPIAANRATEAETTSPHTLGRFLTRSALSISMAISGGAIAGAAEAVMEPHPQPAAATGGYPHADKVCVVGDPNNPNSSYGKVSGTGNWCSGYQWGDLDTGNQDSSRGFGYRNCTDWAAYRAQQITGVLVPYGQAMGHAKDWDDHAPSSYSVDNTPEVGDIAVWEYGDFGHVAVVESVNANGSVNISEYNKNQDGTYGTRSNVTGVDHFIDLDGPGTTAGESDSSAATLARPSAAIFNNALNVFTRGGDGQIYTQYLNGANWSGFSSIGGNMASDPAAIVNGTALNVFARGTDGQIYTKYNNGSGWTGWSSMGSTTMKGNPRVIKYGNELNLYALGANGQPYKNTWQPSGWSGWVNMGNYMDSSPAPLQYSSEMTVVMRGGDNVMYKKTYNGSSWGGFDSLGCCLSGNPDALQYGNQLDIWSNAPDGHIWKRTWNGSSWGNWTDMGGNYAGDPDAMQYNSDLNVFVRGNNGQIYQRYWSASGQFWSAWSSLGGSIAGEPTAVQHGNQLTVFATGTDGRTHRNTFTPSSGWSGFSALPG